MFFIGFVLTTTTVLTPFIINGYILEYFRSQILTSVHTMLSAGAANFPWLISISTRIVKNGFSFGMKSGGNLLVIEPKILRQFIYISLGILCLTLFLLWIVQQLKLSFEVDYFKAASLMLLLYYLFSAGVHENHIFPILALTFTMTSTFRGIVIYCLLTGATFANLFINYGLGRSLGNLGQISSSNHILYQFIIFSCFLIYSKSLFEIYQIRRNRE